MIADKNIAQLLDAISQRNCEKSYKELFMLMHKKLYQFAYSILQSNEDAEEVVSDFFINIWQKRSSISTIQKPKLYFFVSIKNASLNRLKSNKLVKVPSMEQWQMHMESVFFNPEELMLSDEFTRRIMTCVNELPARCRLIFKLVKEDGLKYTETAQLLEISVKTVEAQMAIALRRLKACIGFENNFPEIHSLLSQKK